MSQYTTLTLLARRLDPAVLAGLADDVNTPPDIEAAQTVAVIGQAIADGAALIDAQLGARMDLTGIGAWTEDAGEPPALQGAAAALERLNATLALYFLYQRRCLDDSANPLALARELAEAHLRNVACGREQLGGGDGPMQNEAWSSTECIEPLVSRKFLARF